MKASTYQSIDISNLYRTYLSSQKFSEISFEELSKEQQKELIKKAQSGDSASMEYLILSNLNLVIFIIDRYYKSSINKNNWDDMIQLGIIGLYKGINKYYKEDVAFSTAMSYYIRQNFNLYLGKLFYDSSVSWLMINKASKYKRLLQEREALGETLTDEEAKELLNLNDTEFANLKLFLSRKTEYLDKSTKDETILEDRNEYLAEESYFVDDVIRDMSSYNLSIFLKEVLSPLEYFVLYNRVLEEKILDR